MQYIVKRIEEDLDFGCEERADDAPVMAVVTLIDETKRESKLRQPDQMLYDRDINVGDTVILNKANELQKYENPNTLHDRYELRPICEDEAEVAAAIEAICFPPAEACTLPIMKERVRLASNCFLVVIHKESGRMVGFINGLCTNDRELKDELFTDTSLHDPKGRNIMICSVAVLPEYRKQGIAREMMREFLRWQQSLGRRQAILTCVPEKISMYHKFGFTDRGESDSTWGGECWHEMGCILNAD